MHHFNPNQKKNTSHLCSLLSFVLIRPPCENQWVRLQSGGVRSFSTSLACHMLTIFRKTTVICVIVWFAMIIQIRKYIDEKEFTYYPYQPTHST